MGLTRCDWESVRALVHGYGAGFMENLVVAVALWATGLLLWGWEWMDSISSYFSVLGTLPLSPCEAARCTSDKIFSSRFGKDIPWHQWFLHGSVVMVLIGMVSFAFQASRIFVCANFFFGMMIYILYGNGPLGRGPSGGETSAPSGSAPPAPSAST